MSELIEAKSITCKTANEAHPHDPEGHGQDTEREKDDHEDQLSQLQQAHQSRPLGPHAALGQHNLQIGDRDETCGIEQTSQLCCM